METATLQLPPFFLEVDGVPVQVVEVHKREMITGEVWYIVSVRIIYKKIASRTYTLFVKNTRDLVNKLKVEITKLKFIDYGYGMDEVRRLIS